MVYLVRLNNTHRILFRLLAVVGLGVTAPAQSPTFTAKRYPGSDAQGGLGHLARMAHMPTMNRSTALVACAAIMLLTAHGKAQDKPAAKGDAAEILAAMSNPRLAPKELIQFEARLREMSVTDALPHLVHSPNRTMPKGLIYNGASFKIEKDYPHAWRLFFSLNRVEVHLRRKSPIHELERALQLINPNCDTHEARLRIYWECWSRIPKGIRSSAKIVMEDKERLLSTRVMAARTALQFSWDNSYEAVCNFAFDNDVVGALLRDFTRIYSGKPNHDPRLVDYVFAAVAKAKAAKPEDAFGGYSQAQDAGRLVGQNFDPSHKVQKSATLSRNEVAAAAVQAALAWWQAERAARGR